jgi:hypothetical protein
MTLSLLAHRSPTYPPRTFENAQSSDLTLALALDFTTAGERLTKKAAGDRYLGLPLTLDPLDAGRALWSALHALGKPRPRLNIAGNGIYSLLDAGWTQARVNAHVFALLTPVHQHLPLGQIRSGGQTGVDWAGLAAGVALGVPTLGLFPNGFLQRDGAGQEAQHRPSDLRARLLEDARVLRPAR